MSPVAEAHPIHHVTDLDMPPLERLTLLVDSCDYKGPAIREASCSCQRTWACHLRRGKDRARPHEVDQARCFQCVLGQVEDAADPEPPAEAQAEATAEAPGLMERAASLAGSVIRHVAAGMPRASAEVKATRLAICGACLFNAGGTCRRCGCNLALKASWALERCPIGKWGAVPPAAAPAPDDARG